MWKVLPTGRKCLISSRQWTNNFQFNIVILIVLGLLNYNTLLYAEYNIFVLNTGEIMLFFSRVLGYLFSQWLGVLVRNIVLWKIDTLFYFFGSSDGVNFKFLYRTFITRWCISFLRENLSWAVHILVFVEENKFHGQLYSFMWTTHCALLCLVCHISLKYSNSWGKWVDIKLVSCFRYVFQTIICRDFYSRELMFISWDFRLWSTNVSFVVNRIEIKMTKLLLFIT